MDRASQQHLPTLVAETAHDAQWPATQMPSVAHGPDLLAVLCTRGAVLAGGALAVPAERRLLQAGRGGGGTGAGRRSLGACRWRKVWRHDRVQQVVLQIKIKTVSLFVTVKLFTASGHANLVALQGECSPAGTEGVQVAEDWTQHLLCGKDLQSALLGDDLCFRCHRIGVCGRRRTRSWAGAGAERHCCTQHRRQGAARATSHHVVQLNAAPRWLQYIPRSKDCPSAAGAVGHRNPEVPDYAVDPTTAAPPLEGVICRLWIMFEVAAACGPTFRCPALDLG
jgi:hypothetical protein